MIPYLIWNTIAILLTFLKLLPLFNEFQTFDADFQFSIQSLLGCFWDNSHGFFSARIDSQPANSAIYPIDYPLWFLRDLMLIVVCTPLLYRMLKRIGVHAVIGLGLLWFTMGYWDLGHANQLMNALFFFSWGAYLSIHRKDMLEIFGRYFKRSMWIYPLFALSYIIAMHGWPEAAFTIKRLNIVAGLLFAYNAAAWLLNHGICHPTTFLAASSFFIYVSHALICSRLLRILFVLTQPQSDMAILGVYTTATLSTLMLLLSAFYLMKRYTPRLLKIIAGRA